MGQNNNINLELANKIAVAASNLESPMNLWEEAGIPGGNQDINRENMQIPQNLISI